MVSFDVSLSYTINMTYIFYVYSKHVCVLCGIFLVYAWHIYMIYWCVLYGKFHIHDIFMVHCLYIFDIFVVYCSQDCLRLFPLISTTSATVVLLTTLYQPFLTRTACGLYVHSSSSTVLCVLCTRPNVGTTVVQKISLPSWFFSALLKIFACEPLAQ
jgi:hypothetical protein